MTNAMFGLARKDKRRERKGKEVRRREKKKQKMKGQWFGKIEIGRKYK